jgi:hypothetical protein
MSKVDQYITKEGNIFYLDLESYNAEADILFEEGDTIKFNYDGNRYIGIIVNRGGGKTGIYNIDISKKI